MFQKLSASLEKATARLHASEGVRRGRLLLSWVEAVGQGLAHHAAPADIQGDTLHLVCSGPTWAQEILLRQKEILARLNRLVGDPPLRRIRCRTGRFHPLDGPPATAREEAFPWESVRLDAATQERIDRLVAEIQDPLLAERVRRLVVQTERRRALAFASGAIACGQCGSPTRRDPCRHCQREARARRRADLVRRLGREPWLTRSDLACHFANLGPEEFDQVRTGLKSRLERDIWSAIRALPAGTPLPPPLRASMVELVMLSTGLPAHRLDVRHIRHALCPTLAKAWLEDQACGPWDASKPSSRWKTDEEGPPTRPGTRRPSPDPLPRRPGPGGPT